MSSLKVAILATSAWAFATAAAAQVGSHRSLSSDVAADLARETVSQCKAKGHSVSVAVVDGSGVLKAFLRGEGASLATIEVSQRKAFTSAAFGAPTAALADAAAKGVGAAPQIPHLPGMFLVPGGVPIRVDTQLAGAVGASGAPGGHLDVECIEAAIAKLSARLK
jgi:uncharacterized protein GlcG (DUF336 family)